jgi:hypothetical protein
LRGEDRRLDPLKEQLARIRVVPERTGPSNLEGTLDELEKASDGSGSVSIGEILDTIGQRSFGPFLLVLALIAFTPLGGIPGLPTALAFMVIVIAGQLLFNMKQFWLPNSILRRSIERQRLRNSIGYIRPVARIVDKVIRPRLSWLTKEPFVHVAAGLCILVALTVPPLEVVPFAGAVSWAAIAALGLALIAHDGVLALIALGFTIGAAYAVFTTLL